MAQTKNKYQIIQKVSEQDTILLHPETEAGVVEYDNAQSGLSATTVQGAIDELSNGIGVTGVKGNAEQTYRTGNVNLTAANIGAEESGAVATHNSSNSAHSDIRSAVSAAQTKADQAYALAEGRSRGESFTNIQTFVNTYNELPKLKRNVGDAIYIQTQNVPDLWVYEASATPGLPYQYTTDEAFVNDLKTQGAVNLGFYHVAALEADKVDLTEYQKKTDNSLTTTSKTVVGAIGEVKTTADNASSTASSNATEITKIKNGTTKVGSASSADSATEATSATKWKTARTIGVSVNSGTKSDGSTAITGSGSQSVDGSADKTISVTLGNSGVTAGTYSAVQVNAKGIAVAGGQMIEIGTSGQTTPSASLATGGLFFKEI